MRDEAVVFEIIPQIGDAAEALAFHDDERAEHSFFGKACAASLFRFGFVGN